MIEQKVRVYVRPTVVKGENNTRIKFNQFLAPTGAQEVTMLVRPSVRS